MKAPLEKVRCDVPSLYVGESSRSLFERGGEHWADWRTKKSSSHIAKHQEEAHKPEDDPQFTMRIIRSYRSALGRQVGEAVRIRRRGGEGMILNSKAEYNRCVIPRLVLDRFDEEEWEKLENEELESKKKQMEDELAEWENIRFYARESKLNDMKRKIRRIEKKISARKRITDNQEEDGQKTKRMRKLNFPLLGEDWGVVPNNQQGVREHPSLAGRGSEGMLGSNEVVCSMVVDEGGAPCIATSPTDGVGEVDGRGAAPAPAPAPLITREPARISEQKLRQPIISELLKGVARADCSFEGLSGTIGRKDDVPFGDRVKDAPVVCPGEDDGVGSIPDDPVHHSQGIDSQTCINTVNVKDELSLLGEPSGEESVRMDDDLCTFKRGVCCLHKVRGEKYVDKKKSWLDRGRGRGYGWVTSKVVKYVCKVKEDQVTQKSSNKKWGE